MQLNTENTHNGVKTKGRQVGQRVQSLDLRAYMALKDFDFEAHGDNDSRIMAIIEALRSKDIF